MPDARLPPPMDFDAFAAFRKQPALWLDAVVELARAHRISFTNATPFANGSNLVVALDEQRVLKVFPPMLEHQFLSERATLSKAPMHELSVPIPELIFEGERDGWTYLCMTRLAGRPGEDVWPLLSEPEKERMLFDIGALIAEVQRVPPTLLNGLEPRWETFLPRQIEGCRARHERLGLPARYLDDIDAYMELAAKSSLLRDSVSVGAPRAILTGEYIPENFLVVIDDDGPKLSGLIDFGDVMTGLAQYDLLGPSTFMCGGRTGRVRSLLRGYGVADGLSRDLMLLLLLHRFSDLARQVRIDDWQARAPTLFDLERLIWPI